MVLQLDPLPNNYKQKQTAFRAYHQRNGYQGYHSPLIPVTEAKRAALRPGDLIINAVGLADVYKQPRILSELREGRIVKTVDFEKIRQPRFVWLDHEEESRRESFLADNPLREAYEYYSNAARQMQLNAQANGIEIVQKVNFPLFHETNYDGAMNLLDNGPDYWRIWSRWNKEGGYCFYVGLTKEQTLGKGMKNGALVQIESAPDRAAKWLRNMELYYLLTVDPLNLDQHRLLPTYAAEARRGPIYSISALCAEVGASAFHNDQIAFIFDSFEDYYPREIV
ncbi:MAG: hypothetical protein WCW67_01360 [Candidatus Margulisiibacteriota bacterium]|jgi:hypothetical protein